MTARKLVRTAALAGIGLVLMVSVQVSIFPAAPYLRYDPSDVAVLLAGLTMGPAYAVLAALVKAALFLLLKGTEGPFGAFMNFVATGTLAATAAALAPAGASLPRFLAAGAGGTLAMTLIMIPANLMVVPLQFGIPFAEVWALMLPLYVPFNLIKGALSVTLTVPLYGLVNRYSLRHDRPAGLTPP